MSDLLELVQWRLVPERAVALYRQHEDLVKEAWEKQGYSPALQKILETINIIPGKYPGGIPNHAGPLTGMLTGGLMGAGLGYGLGRLGEAVLPEKWKRRRLRRTMALLGGALGAAPGMAYTYYNVSNKQSPFAQTLKKLEVPPEVKKVVTAAWEKAAEAGYGGLFWGPPIDVNEFNQIVWKDPRVSRVLPAPTQAAATGLITGAANLPGKATSRWVTPFDVARMAAGMGVGHVSGALVGKGLGLLMGMPEETQERMKSTGMWAGLVSQLVPRAFGG